MHACSFSNPFTYSLARLLKMLSSLFLSIHPHKNIHTQQHTDMDVRGSVLARSLSLCL